MQQQIDEMLAIDKNISLKAQAFCEKLIAQNFHQFFSVIIDKINRLSSSLPHINSDYDKDEYESLKRLILILNRELCTIIKNLSNQDEDNISQIWTIINSVLRHPDLNFSILKIMIPSISGFMSLCNEKEVKFIFFNNANNENPEAQIVLLMALLEGKVSKSTICVITKKMFQQFQKDLAEDLQKLQQKLENIDSEQLAIDLVCTFVKRLNKYLDILLKLLQIAQDSSDIFYEIKGTIKSRLFLTTLQVCLSIDKTLLLKQVPRKGEMNKSIKDFMLLLKSRYNKINKGINCLKASIFNILNVVIQLILKSTNPNMNEWNELFGFIQSQIIYPAISDLYLLGKHDPKNSSNDSLTQNSLEMVRQLTSLLSIFTEMKVFRSNIIQCINNITTEIEYIFFACICNIERFEQKYFPSRESFIENDSNCKYSPKDHDFFVSTFTKNIIQVTNLQIKDVVDFLAEMSVLFLDQSISIRQFFQERELPQEILNQVQQKNLSIYLHVLQKITNSEYLRNYEKQISPKIIRLIELMTQNFESLPIILKTQILSICLNVSHLWTQKEFSTNIDKLIRYFAKSFSSQHDQAKLFMEFCYSAIIYLVLEDIKMINLKSNKNSHLVRKIFGCLAKILKCIKMNEKHYIYKILSNLMANDVWNSKQSSFDGNFAIFQICYHKVQDFDIFLESNSNTSTNEIQKLLPQQQFLNLIGNCIFSLQLQFDSEDQGMQIKITSMREMVIKIIHFFSLFTDLFNQNDLSEICQMLQVLSGTHLKEKVSADLCVIIKNDHLLVEKITQFLRSINQIGRSYLRCISNLIISLQGNLEKGFFTDVLQKIKRTLSKNQITDINFILLQEMIGLINLIFLYEINYLIQSNDMKEICKEIFIIVRKNEEILGLFPQRQSQRFVSKTSDFNELKIKLLQTKCFIFLTKYRINSHWNPDDFGMKQKRFSHLVSQFKNLNSQISLEHLTYFIHAIDDCLKENMQSAQKEFILELGSRLFALKQKQMQIPMYLNKRFSPIVKIKNMIVELTKIFTDQFSTEKLMWLKELLNKLDSFELQTPTPRKMISLTKKEKLLSVQRISNNQDQDIII